jgi:hypothetical protein
MLMITPSLDVKSTLSIVLQKSLVDCSAFVYNSFVPYAFMALAFYA